MKRPIADLWSTYAERVLPVAASILQTKESKRAFYAGAHGLFELVTHQSSTKTEQEAMDFMTAVQKDAELFCKEVKRGKA